MSTCTWKLPFIYTNKRPNYAISERNRVISPGLLYRKFKVYNGKIWNIIYVKKYNFGFKFGEFSLSKKIFRKKKSVKKKRKQ